MRNSLLVGGCVLSFGLFMACGDSADCGELCDEADASSDSTARTDTSGLDASGSDTNSTMDVSTSDVSQDVVVTDGPKSDAPADSSGGIAMSFFVTSVGSGNLGGNLGGLAGADAICQTAAAAVGAGGKTWRAYLSTNVNNGGTLVHAKDRIGAGPWYNQKLQLIASNVAGLHAADLPAANVIDQNGVVTPANRHDILTGSTAGGEATMDNCQNWTSNGGNRDATLGHSDSSTTGNGADRWNNAHASNGCSQNNLLGTGGDGRIYCFAL